MDDGVGIGIQPAVFPPAVQIENQLAMSTAQPLANETISEPSMAPATRSEPRPTVRRIVGINWKNRRVTNLTSEMDNELTVPCYTAVETELDSTGSTPPPPLATASRRPSVGPSARSELQLPRTNLRLNIRTMETRGQTCLPNQVERQYNNTFTRTSPVKINKHLKIKRRQASRASSDVWDHFTPENKEDGPVAICNYCGQVYTCDRAIHGTSTLRKHLMNLCKLSPYWDPEKRRKLTFQGQEKGTPKHSFNIEDCRRALAEMVITDETPFTVVDGEGFKNYSKTLEPRFDLPSRITLARDCLKRYAEEKTRVKNSLKGHRICLTTDTWTSIQNLNYMSLTAHWVDHEWQLQKRVLNFCLVPDHKGDTLGEKIEECLLE